jgi:hypothetical protein
MSAAEDFHLPSGEAFFHCDCGYASPEFCYGDHLYACRTCRSIVFPKPVPFMYIPPPCNQCGRQLKPDERLLAARMTPDDRAACPRCEATSLRLQDLQIHFLISELGDATPDVGQVIHARTLQPQRVHEPFGFFSPRLLARLAVRVSVDNRHCNTISDGHHMFRTISAGDSTLVVDYVRELTQQEWRWYFG